MSVFHKARSDTRREVLSRFVGPFIRGPRLEALEQGGRANNFAVLRLAAASLVVWGHSFSISGNSDAEPLKIWLQDSTWCGAIAVNIFFVISGFLVFRSLERSSTWTRFVAARVLRIFPGLVVCNLFIILIIGSFNTDYALRAYLTDTQTWRFMVANLATHWPTYNFLPGVFQDNPFLNVNAPYWTLPSEIRAYALLALFGGVLIVLGRHLPLRRNQIGAAGALILVVFGVMIGTYGDFREANVTGLYIYFAMGMIYYWYRSYIPINHWLAIVLLIVWALLGGSDYFLSASYFVMPYLIIYVAYGLPHIRLERFGDFSYGIYIYAFPIQQSLLAAFPDIGPYAMFAAAVPLTLVLAAASWHFVEKPALRLKDKVPRYMRNPLRTAT